MIIEYRFFRLKSSNAAMAQNDKVLTPLQDYNNEVSIPYTFSSEEEAEAWADANESFMNRQHDVILLPLRRMR